MDVGAMKYFPESMKLSSDKSEIWINGQLRRYNENKYGLMAIVLKSSGELIGQCGLLNQLIDSKEEIEIGYHLLPKFWKNGYATEAVKLFKVFAFENDLAESLISIIHTENIASQKVAERNGMTRSSSTTFRDMEAYVYRITKEENLYNL